LFLCGCESDIPGPKPPPPAPPLVAASSTDSPRPDSREIAFILPHPNRSPAAAGVWEQALRVEARERRLIVESMQPGPKDAYTRQGDLIRAATIRGVAGVLVVPDPESAPALEEARQKGTSLVLIDRGVTMKGKPLPVVTFDSAETSAETLVQYALKAVKDFGLNEQGPALIVQNKTSDPHSEERARALERALKKQNVSVLPVLRFSDPQKELVAKTEELLAAHPKLPMVLVVDESALKTLYETRNGLPSGSRFAVAAYGSAPRLRNFLTMGQAAAIADVSDARLARRALETLWEAVEGKAVPEHVYVEIPVQRAARNDDQLTMPAPRAPEH
jgi:ABC-type sugar transport system substrate-binding protein